MNNKLVFICFGILLALLTACGAEYSDSNPIKLDFEDPDSLISESEVIERGFVYRLYTTEGFYNEGDKVNITAELEYVGELEEVTISHAASPFYFPMHEASRDYDIEYPMNTPLLVTVLKKGEPLVETYTGAGGYSDEDSKEYIEFMKQVMNQQFPNGKYLVTGLAEFYDETNGASYKFDGQIQFVVE